MIDIVRRPRGPRSLWLNNEFSETRHHQIYKLPHFNIWRSRWIKIRDRSERHNFPHATHRRKKTSHCGEPKTLPPHEILTCLRLNLVLLAREGAVQCICSVSIPSVVYGQYQSYSMLIASLGHSLSAGCCGGTNKINQ